MIFSNQYNRQSGQTNTVSAIATNTVTATNTATNTIQNSLYSPLNFRYNMIPSNSRNSLISLATANQQQSRPLITSLKQAINPQDTSAVVPKKVLWGPPTWFLLHTLSCKIYEDRFAALSNDILKLIYMICTNLPCPDCANHAKTYLDGINFNAIQTKEDLKKMLFNFHNTVNQRKGYPIFSYTDYTTKYSKAITTNIIENFMHYFSDRTRSPKLMASDFQRTHIVKYLRTWFQSNLSKFSM